MNHLRNAIEKSKKELNEEYYIQNREKIIKNTTAWNEKNRKYHREYDKRRRARNPTKSRSSYLKRTYKMSLREFEDLNLIQGGRCAICLRVVKRLVIDQ